MIPEEHISDWSKVAPWAEQSQTELDLIISRAMVNIFSDDMLREELRMRGGTALNKLHFPKPYRYSEDIDVNRTTAGPIGPILSQLRTVLEPWLGTARFNQSPIAPKLLFRINPTYKSEAKIRLKVEISTREIIAFDDPLELPFEVSNPWFSGKTTIPTFSNEEMLATKLRALLGRDKGRDLFDVAHGLDVFENINPDRVVELFRLYADQSEERISRAQAQQRMFAKMAKPRFIEDLSALLPASDAESLTNKEISHALLRVSRDLVERFPGDPWAKLEKNKEKYGISW